MGELSNDGVYMFCAGDDILEYLPELEGMFEEGDESEEGDDNVALKEVFTCVVIDGKTHIKSSSNQEFIRIDGLDAVGGLDVVSIAKGLVDMDVKTNGCGVSPYPLSLSRIGKKTYITLLDVSKTDKMQVCYVVETGSFSVLAADPVNSCQKDNLLSCICYGLMDLSSSDAGVLLASAEVVKDFFSYPSVHFEGENIAETFKKTWPAILEKYVDIRAFFEGELSQRDQRKALLCGVDEGQTYSSDDIVAKYSAFCAGVFEICLSFIETVGGKSAY